MPGLARRPAVRGAQTGAMLGTVVRLVLGLLALAAAALLAVQGYYLIQVWRLAEAPPGTTAFMERRLAELREDDPDARLRHRWVPYERISPWLARAVVAAEDARFMEHNGFDWEALGKVLEQNVEAGGIVRGGSTITQQLAKNLFLSPTRSYLRKAQEAVIAVMLEAVLSKRRILELYLNLIEWGDRSFGAEAAARLYHDESAAALDRWQAALLAARIPRPRYYDGRGVTDYLYRRASDIHRWADHVRVP